MRLSLAPYVALSLLASCQSPNSSDGLLGKSKIQENTDNDLSEIRAKTANDLMGEVLDPTILSAMSESGDTGDLPNLEDRYHLTKPLSIEACSVDTSQFPAVTLTWKKDQAPGVNWKGWQKEPILFQETSLVNEEGGDEIALAYPTETQSDIFRTTADIKRKIVNIAVAMDKSGSMDDNQGAVRAIQRQLERYYEKVNIFLYRYDETGVYNDEGDRIYYGTADCSPDPNRLMARGDHRIIDKCKISPEEDHVGAIWQGATSLEEMAGDKYVVVVTDEGLKTGLEYKEEVIKGAKAASIKIILLLDKSDTDFNTRDQFESLEDFARSTGGRVINMNGRNGTIPSDIFRTNFYQKERYVKITFTDALANHSGDRSILVPHGQGAYCTYNIDQNDL